MSDEPVHFMGGERPTSTLCGIKAIFVNYNDNPSVKQAKPDHTWNPKGITCEKCKNLYIIEMVMREIDE